MSDHHIRNLNSHSEAINAIRFTYDGNYCMTASSDRSLKLWNPHKNSILPDDGIDNKDALLIKTYDGTHGYPIHDVALFRDNSRFVSAGVDKACFVTDVATGRIIRRIQAHTHNINTIGLNADDTVLASGSYDKTVCLWDLRSNNREPIQTLKDCKDSVTSLVLSDSTIVVGSIDATVRIYDLRQGLCHCDDLQNSVIHITLSHDQKSVLATCLGGTIKLLDMSTGKILNEYQGGHVHKNYKLESCFANDDQHILATSEDGSLCHYNILTKAVVRKTEKLHVKSISSISYHPTEPLFVTASYNGTAACWRSDKYSYH